MLDTCWNMLDRFGCCNMLEMCSKKLDTLTYNMLDTFFLKMLLCTKKLDKKISIQFCYSKLEIIQL